LCKAFLTFFDSSDRKTTMQIRQFVLLAAAVFAVCGITRFSAAEDTTAAKSIPVILNTDIGDDIDDTWAVMALARLPQFDVKLITTAYGKPEYRAKLVAKLLMAAKRTDIPIGLGVGSPKGAGPQLPLVKDFQLSDYPGRVDKDGVQAMIDVIEQSPTPVTVIAIGPLDTMAALVEKRPDLAKKAIFVGMQGGVFKGYNNGSIAPEWNVKADVKASQKVFSAPWRKMVITPLDTCGLVSLTGKRFEALKASKNPCVQAVLENYRVWSENQNKHRKMALSNLHQSTILFDTVAVYLADPSPRTFVKFQTLPIVVTETGVTKVDPKGQKVEVATEWTDKEGFYDWLMKSLGAE
jgi:inosine-uridine nucleoside N-ribohydrolase